MSPKSFLASSSPCATTLNETWCRPNSVATALTSMRLAVPVARVAKEQVNGALEVQVPPGAMTELMTYCGEGKIVRTTSLTACGPADSRLADAVNGSLIVTVLIRGSRRTAASCALATSILTPTEAV